MRSRLFILLLLVIFFFPVYGQEGFSTKDKELIAGQNFVNPVYDSRTVVLGFGNNNKVLDYSLGSLMYVYQRFISRQISASCLYSPSCSGYSKLLFKSYGPVKAFLSTMDRLMRCDRLSATDFHPQDIDPHTHRKHESVEYYGKLYHRDKQ